MSFELYETGASLGQVRSSVSSSSEAAGVVVAAAEELVVEELVVELSVAVVEA